MAKSATKTLTLKLEVEWDLEQSRFADAMQEIQEQIENFRGYATIKRATIEGVPNVIELE